MFYHLSDLKHSSLRLQPTCTYTQGKPSSMPCKRKLWLQNTEQEGQQRRAVVRCAHTPDDS